MGKIPPLRPATGRIAETSTHNPARFLVPIASRKKKTHASFHRLSPANAIDFEVWIFGFDPKHVETFEEVAASTTSSLKALGFTVDESRGPFPRGRATHIIVFGCNDLQRTLPANAIIYQLEQFVPRWMTRSYLDRLRKHIVWDMSPRNVQRLRAHGCQRVHLCRIGSRDIPINEGDGQKDIDVLFYGSINERRDQIIKQLKARGLNVHAGGGLWGDHRDRLIHRAKVVLNLHYYHDAVLEMVRLLPALESGALIVSEIGSDPQLEETFKDGIIFAPYGGLVDAVVGVLAKPDAERAELATKSTAAFQTLSHKKEIGRCVAESLPGMKSRRVKCFINNFNRLAWTQKIVREIERLGGEPIIVDNASSYPALLMWYATEPCRVVRLARNEGARAPWVSGTIAREVQPGECYVVTDPDLDLSGVPADALEVLRRGLERHGSVCKAGLSLALDDVPRELLDMRQVNNRTLEQIERDYWKRRLDAEFWDANVDTTFAMYRWGGRLEMDVHFYRGIRADKPYTARHLPWYRTEKDFDDEDRYYVAHRQVTAVNGTWYDSVQGK